MKVLNIHERNLSSSASRAGELIDSLASPKDALWPNQSWPRMVFDRPLGVGASGGHGPIRYFVEEYCRGGRITFRFTGPAGFDGFHQFELCDIDANRCVLRHTLQMKTHGAANLSWPLVFRPMHDALIEDSLDQAEASLGCAPRVHKWPVSVRILRWLVSGAKSRGQIAPKVSLR